MSSPKTNASGYLFPLPSHLIEKLFSGRKDVFIKLSRYRLLSEGNTLLFYSSGRSDRKIAGEAKIKRIVYDDPENIWKEFGERIVLDKEEFEEYVKRSPLGPRVKKKKMTAFVLVSIRKYSKPKKPEKRVTPAGYYLE